MLHLAGFSPVLARAYFSLALSLCRLTGIQPSLLLHPLDFLGADDGLEPLKFFPGMNIPAATKLAWMDDFLGAYARRFTALPMGAHVDALNAEANLREIAPEFARTAAVVPAQAG